MPRTLGYLVAIANNNLVSVCLGVWRISRPAQAKSEVVQGVVGASPRSCAQRPRTQVVDRAVQHAVEDIKPPNAIRVVGIARNQIAKSIKHLFSNTGFASHSTIENRNGHGAC